MSGKCYFDNELCAGELWQCQTCHEKFCQFHSHQGDKGIDIECANCERIRVGEALEASGRSTVGSGQKRPRRQN